MSIILNLSNMYQDARMIIELQLGGSDTKRNALKKIETKYHTLSYHLDTVYWLNLVAEQLDHKDPMVRYDAANCWAKGVAHLTDKRQELYLQRLFETGFNAVGYKQEGCAAACGIFLKETPALIDTALTSLDEGAYGAHDDLTRSYDDEKVDHFFENAMTLLPTMANYAALDAYHGRYLHLSPEIGSEKHRLALLDFGSNNDIWIASNETHGVLIETTTSFDLFFQKPDGTNDDFWALKQAVFKKMTKDFLTESLGPERCQKLAFYRRLG